MDSYSDRYQYRRYGDVVHPAGSKSSGARRATTPTSAKAWVGVGRKVSPAPGTAARRQQQQQLGTSAHGVTEWSGRAMSPPSLAERHGLSGTSSANAAACWMCAKPCTAHGWCQVNSSLVHRIVFYPASLFTLCSTCGRAISLAPGTSLVDVVSRCHPTSATRSHSHAFVSFLREYMVLLESAYLDLEDDAAASGHVRNRPSMRRRVGGTDGHVCRDDVTTLTPRIVDQLMTCIGEALRDREALTIKEAHLLMAEAASLEAHAEDRGFPPMHFGPDVPRRGPTTTGAMSPEQRYLRSHPLLEDARRGMAPSFAVVSEAAGSYSSSGPSNGTPRRSATVAATPPARRRLAEGDDASASSEQQQLEYVLLNGVRYVKQQQHPPATNPSFDDHRRVDAANHRGGGEEEEAALQRNHRHHAADQQQQQQPAASTSLPEGPSKRLLEAAEEFAVAEQRHDLEREDWNAEREELRRHLAAAEAEVRVMRERVSVKDRESDTLVVRNTEMAERLATLDSSSTMQAHFALLGRIAVHHANMAADAAQTKARLFAESASLLTSNAIALGRQLRRTKEELEHAKQHVARQQKMIEASRRAVMQAWSEKAGIDGSATTEEQQHAYPTATATSTSTHSHASPYADTDTTLF